MRTVRLLLWSGSVLFSAQSAFAADTLQLAPAPSWVKPSAIPDTQPTDAPIALLLHDQQTSLADGKITSYVETAFRIQTAEGLAAGNLSIEWQPSIETVTVHKLQIRRGDKVIDVLANGQTFTILRRETNLDAATLDGRLTANIQPEGLQQGDIVDLATTVEHADPALKGHVETTFAGWNGVPIELGHAIVSWPSALNVNVRTSGPLPQPARSSRNGTTIISLTAARIQPMILPSSAPARFSIGRFGEASDFKSWADVANLMAPLYHDASVVAASGALHDEVERIRKSASDPRRQAEQALSLVQDRVRYVALLMGQGGYVPVPAETTWSRRFGDCKAKTALLLAILHTLGIESEPVLAQSKLGDIVSDRLPMVAMFDHVLVRAHIGGKVYWLDGTRTGDNRLDDIQPPNFGWALPVIANASLIHVIPPVLDRPIKEIRIDIDASGGVLAPASIAVSTTHRGDVAVVLNSLYSRVTAEQRQEALRGEANKLFDGFQLTSSSVQFDKADRTLVTTQKGTAKLGWDDGWFNVPNSSIGYNPDFQRAPGPLHDVPFATNYPDYEHRVVTVHLPPAFGTQEKLPAAVHDTLAGVEYRRTITMGVDALRVDSTERTVAPEIAYKAALADESRLRKLSEDDVYLRLPSSYRPTTRDVTAMATDKPASTDEFISRGNAYLNGGKLDQAIADFTQALAIDPKNVTALGDRAIAYVWRHDFATAEKDLAAAEAIAPADALILRTRGLAAELNGDCAKAVDWYTRSLAKDEHDFAFTHRATCEVSLSKDDEALADAAQALKMRPDAVDMRLLRANILHRQGKPELVQAEVEALTRDNPDSGYAWVVAGKTLAAVGQRAKALGAFERALTIKPEAYIYINRAEVRPMSDFAGRVADLDAALKLEPNNADALAAKAELLSDSGEYKGALALFDRIKPDPGDHAIDQERALVLLKAGRINEGEKLFRAIRARAKTASDFNNLCWTKATAGVMLESALQDCRDALKLSPEAGGYLDSLGMVLLKLGRLDEAVDAYDRAIAKGTGAVSLMGRAIAHLRKADRPQAEADAKAARALNSNIDDEFTKYGLKFDSAGKAADASRRLR